MVSVDDATRVEMLRAVRYACAVYGATLPFYQSIGESVKMHALFRGGIDDTDEAITRQVLPSFRDFNSSLALNVGLQASAGIIHSVFGNTHGVFMP